MSTKPERFTSEKAILDAIDRNRRNGERSLDRAAKLENEAAVLFRKAWESEQANDGRRAECLRRQGKELLKRCDGTRAYATMLLEHKAKRLGERLAEFRTANVVPLFGLKGVGDMSVEGVK